MFKNSFYFLIVYFILHSCATVRVVKPLEKKKIIAGGSIALPNISTNIPSSTYNSTITPSFSLFFAYGITNKTSIFSGINYYNTGFENVTYKTPQQLSFDIGSTIGILKQNRYIPGVSVSPILNLTFELISTKFFPYPELNINTYWEFGKKLNFGKAYMFYLNYKNFFDVDLNAINSWYPSLTFGQQFNSKKFTYNVELRYLFLNQSNSVFKNIQSLTQVGGVLGIYFGVSYRFRLKYKNIIF